MAKVEVGSGCELTLLVPAFLEKASRRSLRIRQFAELLASYIIFDGFAQELDCYSLLLGKYFVKYNTSRIEEPPPQDPWIYNYKECISIGSWWLAN